MKKIIAVLLAAFLVAGIALVPVAAAPGEPSFGSVKKVNDGDIDMGKADMSEPAWANATKVNINHLDDGEAFGDVYLLWSDTALYAFFDITDITPDATDNGRAQDNCPWEEDSVEWFIDITNGGEHCEQFRVDRFNVPSYYPQGGAWMDDFYIGVTKISDCEPVPPGHMSWAVKVDGNKYYVKMKITFFGNISAGNVGMNFQINNYGGTPVWPTNYEGSSWTSDVYWYVTLIEEMAYVAPPPVEDVPAAVEETPVAPAAPEAGGAVSEDPPSVVFPAPATGDCGMIILAVLMVAAAAGIVVFKKHNAK